MFTVQNNSVYVGNVRVTCSEVEISCFVGDPVSVNVKGFANGIDLQAHAVIKHWKSHEVLEEKMVQMSCPVANTGDLENRMTTLIQIPFWDCFKIEFEGSDKYFVKGVKCQMDTNDAWATPKAELFVMPQDEISEDQLGKSPKYEYGEVKTY